MQRPMTAAESADFDRATTVERYLERKALRERIATAVVAASPLQGPSLDVAISNNVQHAVRVADALIAELDK